MHVKSAPYTPQQNGTSERSNRTIIEMVGTILNSCQLNKDMWAEATNTSCYILNRISSSINKDTTPFELWFGRKPNLANICEFGKQVHVLDQSRKESKWSTKTLKAFVVGFTSRSNTYRCYVPSLNRVVITCDVIFRHHGDQQTDTLDHDVGDKSDNSVSFSVSNSISQKQPDTYNTTDQLTNQNIQNESLSMSGSVGETLDETNSDNTSDKPSSSHDINETFVVDKTNKQTTSDSSTPSRKNQRDLNKTFVVGDKPSTMKAALKRVVSQAFYMLM